MFDVTQVTRIALEMGYYELANYLHIQDYKSDYLQFIIEGKVPVHSENDLTEEQNKPGEKKEYCGEIHFIDGKDFVQWLGHAELPFQMSEKEAGIVLGYLEGSGYSLEAGGEQLYLCDDVNQEKEITDLWEVIDKASDMNYELLQEAKKEIANAEIHEDTQKEEIRLSELSAEEKLLDQVIERMRSSRPLVVQKKQSR